jgi:hypothetical protein
VIEVPNAGGLHARLLGRRWHYYNVDHVGYYRLEHLKKLAGDLGLALLDARGYNHFSYPQGNAFKDAVKGALAGVGFEDVVSVFLQAP